MSIELDHAKFNLLDPDVIYHVANKINRLLQGQEVTVDSRSVSGDDQEVEVRNRTFGRASIFHDPETGINDLQMDDSALDYRGNYVTELPEDPTHRPDPAETPHGVVAYYSFEDEAVSFYRQTPTTETLVRFTPVTYTPPGIE